MGLFEGFLFGLFGGILAELLGLFRLRQQAPPDFLKNKFYWLTTVLMVCAGAGLVAVYLRSGMSLTPILAVNIGASGPMIISSLVGQAPATIDPRRVD